MKECICIKTHEKGTYGDIFKLFRIYTYEERSPRHKEIIVKSVSDGKITHEMVFYNYHFEIYFRPIS